MKRKVAAILILCGSVFANASALLLRDQTGALVAEIDAAQGFIDVSGNSGKVIARSATGFRFEVKLVTGVVNAAANYYGCRRIDAASDQPFFYYETSNCTGQAYWMGFNPNSDLICAGTLIQPERFGQLFYYVPKDAVFETKLIRSTGSPLACNAVNQPGLWGFKVFPNDPAVTGIRTVYPAPMKVDTS
jgi:hypothetical protein